MEERCAGRLEGSAARALALLGSPPGAGGAPSTESSTAGGRGGPDASDERLIAARIRTDSTIAPDKAEAVAKDIVDRARRAPERLAQTRSMPT